MADATLCGNCRTITTCLEMGCGQGRAARSSPAPDAPADPDPVEELVDTLDLGAQPEQGESAVPKDQP